MTLYEKLVYSLELGKYPVVIDEDGRYRVFVYMSADKNTLQATFRGSTTIEDSLNSSIVSWNKEEIDSKEKNYGWKLHSFYTPNIKPFEVGDKVRVSKKYLEHPDRYSEIEQRAKNETVLQIHFVLYRDTGVTLYICQSGSSYIKLSHRMLEPVFDDEPVPTTMTKEEYLKLGKANGWVKDGSVIE